MIRRHFFLIAAVVVLGLMAVAGGLKVFTKKAGGGAQAAQGPGAGGSPGGGAGAAGGAGRRGFGGPTLVSVTAAQPRVFQDTIEVLGVAKGRQSVTLSAATTQLIQRVRFADGQHVKAGAVLVELKDTEQDAGLDQAKARLVQAQRAYERYRTLGDKGFASKAAIDQYEAAWRSAQADVAAAQARQNDRIIRAPFSGVVGLSDVAPGALVNPGAPIVTLDDVSMIRVDFQVPERYLAQLRPGQTLLATADAFPGDTITGKIAKLDSRIDERTRAITARAEFPNRDGRLKPGMLMRVGVSRGERTNPALPESAVSVQGEGAFVYVVHPANRPGQGGPGGQVGAGQGQARGGAAAGGFGGFAGKAGGGAGPGGAGGPGGAPRGPVAMVEQRPVVTGARQDGYVEIMDGLKPGERVVSDGLNKVQPGQPVRISPKPSIIPVGGGNGGHDDARAPGGAGAAGHRGAPGGGPTGGMGGGRPGMDGPGGHAGMGAGGQHGPGGGWPHGGADGAGGHPAGARPAGQRPAA